MKPFREHNARNLESGQLKNELNSHGYLMIRGILPTDDINLLLGKMLEIVDAAGWLSPLHERLARIVNPKAACGESDPSFKCIYEQIFSLESFHALAHHPNLRNVMNMLVGPQLLVHPKPIGRLIFPHFDRFVIQAHQDHQSIAGDSESFTAWMPLHDCPEELGPLQIMEASHLFGLQETDPKTGIISKESVRGGDWVGGRINAGDVLIFHSLTVHAASSNISNQLRISMDCRFQDYSRAINPMNLVFPGSSGGRSWEKTYADWRSDSLKFYWKQMPLQLNPSRNELAHFAQTADSPEMRSRYSRILSQLDSSM
jgi:ectoine hydroxylase-related dioxygenase (phytanoyl-CoA dioxygenase family)